MKRSLQWTMVIAGLGLLPQPSLAADMPLKAPPAVMLRDWSGVYAGLNVGVGGTSATWTNLDNTTFFGDSVPPDTFDHGVSGVLGGGQLGINMQRGPWVFGVEALIDASAMRGKHGSSAGAADDQFEARIDTLMLFTGRVGYAWDRLLAYGKAGWGVANVRVSVDDTTGPTTGSGSDSGWRSGPTVGLGVEYALSPTMSVALEYDYLRLDGADYQLGGSAGSYRWTIDMNDVSLVMAKFNVRFGAGL
jgi:outer membrane immunogenic protein